MMDQKEFMGIIVEHGVKSAVQVVKNLLAAPPGRAPAKELLELSGWYNALTDGDKGKIGRIISRSAHSTAFGIFCILDGVRLTGLQREGRFELNFIRPDEVDKILPG